MRFFIDFNDFGSILGGPGASENCKKSLKIDVGLRSERVPACEMILVTILNRFLQVLDGFWKGSGGILEGFWRDDKSQLLQMIISASGCRTCFDD